MPSNKKNNTPFRVSMGSSKPPETFESIVDAMLQKPPRPRKPKKPKGKGK